MKVKLIDTNIIIRYLVEDKTDKKYNKIFTLFEQIETKDEQIHIDNLVLFESFFVLTSFYEIPKNEVLEKLQTIIEFAGVSMNNKRLIQSTFSRMNKKSIDLVDAYLIELALYKDMQVFSNDRDLIKAGIKTIKL